MASLALTLNERIGDTRFLWAEALWLPKWKVHAIPSVDYQKNIEKIAKKLDGISHIFKASPKITSWFRPENYNAWGGIHGVGGAQNSSHMLGMAVDFYFDDITCDEVRKILQPKLVELEIRLENKSKAPWVHVDIRSPGPGGRYFRP